MKLTPELRLKRKQNPADQPFRWFFTTAAVKNLSDEVVYLFEAHFGSQPICETFLFAMWHKMTAVNTDLEG